MFVSSYWFASRDGLYHLFRDPESGPGAPNGIHKPGEEIAESGNASSGQGFNKPVNRRQRRKRNQLPSRSGSCQILLYIFCWLYIYIFLFSFFFFFALNFFFGLLSHVTFRSVGGKRGCLLPIWTKKGICPFVLPFLRLAATSPLVPSFYLSLYSCTDNAYINVVFQHMRGTVQVTAHISSTFYSYARNMPRESPPPSLTVFGIC